MTDCTHCRGGWFEGRRFGEDIHCVNGVLIDIDEAYEGPALDVVRPVAPCHPSWDAQIADPDGDWPNDSIERIEAWLNSHPPQAEQDSGQ